MSLNKNKFYIDVESLLWLPGHIGAFWKDCDGRYMGCNDVAAEKIRLSSRQDVVDRTDFDIPTLLEHEAKQIQAGDREVLQAKQPLYFLNSATNAGAENFFITFKSPLLNSDNKIVGVFGIDTFIDLNQQESYLPLLEKTGISINEINAVKEKIKNNFRKSKSHNLTQRQMDCLYYLVKGMTIKEIAATLDLSPKTVEHYLNTIKTKLHCYKKSNLITKAFEIPYIRSKLNLLPLISCK